MGGAHSTAGGKWARSLFSLITCAFFSFWPGVSLSGEEGEGGSVDAELEELGELEESVRDRWGAMLAQVTEEELIEIRRRVAAAAAGEVSGALGQARKCASVAAGVGPWMVASESEMQTLTLSPESLNTALAGLERWQALQTTGAGVLAIRAMSSPWDCADRQTARHWLRTRNSSDESVSDMILLPYGFHEPLGSSASA